MAALLFGGGLAVNAAAQTRRGVRIGAARPSFGRVNGAHPLFHRPYYGSGRFCNRGFSDPLFDSYNYDGYYNARRQDYRLRDKLKGDQNELDKHLEKYNCDGVITAAERKKLNDDYRDIVHAKQELQEFYDE